MFYHFVVKTNWLFVIATGSIFSLIAALGW